MNAPKIWTYLKEGGDRKTLIQELDKLSNTNSSTSKRYRHTLLTTLLIAAQFGRIDILQWLLDHHIHVSGQSLKGMTALHYAARNGHPAICKLLLDHGAATHVRNNWNETPEECTKEQKCLEIIRAFKPKVTSDTPLERPRMRNAEKQSDEERPDYRYGSFSTSSLMGIFSV